MHHHDRLLQNFPLPPAALNCHYYVILWKLPPPPAPSSPPLPLVGLCYCCRSIREWLIMFAASRLATFILCAGKSKVYSYKMLAGFLSRPFSKTWKPLFGNVCCTRFYKPFRWPLFISYPQFYLALIANEVFFAVLCYNPLPNKFGTGRSGVKKSQNLIVRTLKFSSAENLITQRRKNLSKLWRERIDKSLICSHLWMSCVFRGGISATCYI